MKSEIMLKIKKLENLNKVISTKMKKFEQFERQMEDFAKIEASQD